jgi:DUF971 family protein
MDAQPTQLKLIEEDRLRIDWSDGQVREYSLRELRDACPCATCSEKRKSPPASSSMLPILSAAETAPLRIARMEAMGNYAYAIGFSDGHDTGIFTLELLRELGHVV